VAKYRRDGVSLSEAMKVANAKVAADAWQFTKAEAERARLAKEPEPQKAAEVTPPPAAAPAPSVDDDPQVQAVDAKVGQLRTQMSTLLATREEANAKLAAIDAKTKALARQWYSGKLGYEDEEKAKADAATLEAYEAHWRSVLAATNADINRVEEAYEFTQLTRQQAVYLAELRRAREAEVSERARASQTARTTAESTRLQQVESAFKLHLPVVMKEGVPVDQDEAKEFENEALTFLALHPKFPTATAAEIPALLREFKAKEDAKVDRYHRKQSRIHAERKEQDVKINAPAGAAAVAPAVKRGSNYREDGFMGLRSS
jgi:hypothetical protein